MRAQSSRTSVCMSVGWASIGLAAGLRLRGAGLFRVIPGRLGKSSSGAWVVLWFGGTTGRG
jgi:hypothetical protein